MCNPTTKFSFRHYKPIYAIICCLLLSLSIAGGSAYAETIGKLSVAVGGSNISFSVQPELKQGVLMVPVRTFFESLEAQVHWEALDNSVSIRKGDTRAVIKIGEEKAVINDAEVALSAAPYDKEGKTMVPVRLAEQLLGTYLEWDNQTKTANIMIPAEGESPSGQVTAVPATQTVMLENGAKYVGQLQNGLFDGSGKMTWPDGSSYDGRWANGKYHGDGTYIYANGDKYTGEFQNGRRHGYGTYTPAGRTSISGQWVNGRLISNP